MKNSTGKRSAAAFKLKPTMAFAGHATVGALVALAGAGSVFAQGASPAEPAASTPETAVTKAGGGGDAQQQVVVTGIRRGIEAAISVKKNSDQIVEAISAEDIGKLPDTTIAESLARLPGVTTQRDKNGNATNISIRGLGPDFNGYLLNGREQTSTGDSRADDLSVYPAELIAGATVYKTGDASLMTAGLAGTIDNKLIDPLSFPQRVLSAIGEDTETGRGLGKALEGHGHRYSFSYIDQFADRKIGLAIGYVHAFGRSSQVGSGNWGDAAHPTYLPDGTRVQYPDPKVAGQMDDPNLPGFGSGLSLQNTHKRDARDGLAAVLEFKPNPNFTSELDLFHANIQTATKNAYLKIGLSGNITDATVSADNKTVTAGTFTLGANPNGIISDSENIFDNDTLQSLGWRNTAKINDTWRVTADLNHNTAKRIEHDIEVYGGITTPDTLSFTTPNGFGVPQLTVGNPSAYVTPGSIVIRDQTGWSGTTAPQDGYFKGPTTIDKIDAGRLDFTHDLAGGPFSDLQFGANMSSRSKDRKAIEALIVPSSGVATDTIPFPSDSYVEHNVGGTGVDLLTFDPTDALVPGATLQNKYNNDILSKTWKVRENVSTLYGKLDIDTEVGKLPVRGNVGLQYVYTEQYSGGYQANIGSGVTLTNPALSETTAGTHFSDVLPSLNLTTDLGNDLLARFGAGIQIARPNLTDMRNAFTVDVETGPCYNSRGEPTGGNCTGLVGSAGNPYLKPFKAKALDVSFEKYFANKEGYLSGALFYKKLDTYIVPYTTGTYDFTDAIKEFGITTAPSPIGAFTSTVNGHGGNLKGIELTAQIPFSMLTSWLNGFGMNASWSDTTSSVRMPNTLGNNPTQPANAGSIGLLGLSHINKKIMLYFERFGFSAFVAENSRSRYVGSVDNDTIGGYPTLQYIEPQRWVSAQVGYEAQEGWLKGLGVRLEGNNLNKPVYKESNYAGSITNTNKTGASVDVRVSYKF